MSKNSFLIILFLLCTLTLSSQQGIIKGIVIDSINSHPIEFVSIRLFNQSDSLFVKGTSTNAEGFFSLNTISGKYYLDISLLGYKTIKKDIDITKDKLNYDLGTLFIIEDIISLDETVVIAKIPDMAIKGDTIEYNAAAYLSDESGVLQDLVKNLPGVEIDENGNLKANGKIINKITVDGKEFFNNDIQLALKNLPANMVKKLQLFQEETEKSKVSGIKDEEGDQVLNLEIKDEFKRSIFGDVAAGYGNKERYFGKAMINAMQNDNHLSVLAGANNTNSDIENQTLNLSSGGFLGNGIDKKKEAAINFNSQKSDKFKMNGNIQYRYNSNLMEEDSKTENINSGEIGNSITYDNSRSVRDDKSLDFNLNFNWKPDSLTTIFFRSGGSYSENTNMRNSNSLSYYIDKQDTTSGWNQNDTKGNGHNLRLGFNVGRKLNSKGRNVSFSFDGSLRNSENNGFYKSLRAYTSDTEDKIQDQKTKSENDNSSYSFSVSYLEPINDKNNLNISYSIYNNKTDNDNNRYRKEDPSNSDADYTIIDTLYIRSTDFKSIRQKIGIGFQSLHEKYEYYINVSAEPYYSKDIVTTRIDSVETLKQDMVNYVTRLMFKYKINKNAQWNIGYRGSTRQPTSDQLSSKVITLSPTSIRYGNRDLKTTYENAIDFYYQKSNYEKGDFIYMNGSLSNTMNQIVNYTKTDAEFNTVSTFKNMSGNWNANLSLMYNTPIKKDKLSLAAYSSVFYRRNNGFANGEKNRSNTISLNENISFSLRLKKVESNLRIRYNYNLTKNSLQNQNNIEISNIRLANSTILRLPLDFRIENDISYLYNFGYDSDYKKSEVMWNAAVSKQFLKKKTGTLKLQFFDILKDQNNTSRYAGNGYISNMRTNMIGRYFMFSFSYRFNIARGNNNDDYLNEYYY